MPAGQGDLHIIVLGKQKISDMIHDYDVDDISSHPDPRLMNGIPSLAMLMVFLKFQLNQHHHHYHHWGHYIAKRFHIFVSLF